MNVFVRRSEGHEKDIIRVPETSRDLLPEGQVVRWSDYWQQRVVAGMILVGRIKIEKTSESDDISSHIEEDNVTIHRRKKST